MAKVGRARYRFASMFFFQRENSEETFCASVKKGIEANTIMGQIDPTCFDSGNAAKVWGGLEGGFGWVCPVGRWWMF